MIPTVQERSWRPFDQPPAAAGDAGRVAAGVGSLMVLLLVVVGAPIVLAVLVGWPFPRSMPHWEHISTALDGGPVGERVWLQAVACIGWLMWAMFTASTLIEAAAATRGLAARVVPGLGVLQANAGRLVAAAALLFTLVAARPTSARAHAAAPPPAALVTPAHTPAGPSPPAPRVDATVETSPGLITTPNPSAGGPTWTVRRGDNLWRIAQHSLGDGHRWPDIAALNPTVAADPSTLEVGWVLRLPPGAIPSPAAPATTSPTVPGAHVVAPGDTLWAIAQAHLGDPIRWPEIFRANQGRAQPNGATLTDPDVIMPGWRLKVPGSVAVPPPPPTPPRPAPPTPAPEKSAPAPPGTQPAPVPAPGDPLAPGVPDPEIAPPAPALAHQDPTPAKASTPSATDERLLTLVGVGGVVLAAGLAGLIAQARRRRSVLRRPGTQAPRPPDPVLADETAVTAMDTDSVEWLSLELRALSAAVRARPGHPAPRPRLVQVSPERIELLLADAMVRTPSRWRPVRSGLIWQLVEPSPPATLVANSGRLAPMPALVTVGSKGQDLFLVDLEAEGTVWVTGDRPATDALLRSMALELATSPLSDAMTVMVAEELAADLSGCDRVVELPSLASAVERVQATARSVRAGLAAHRYPTTFAARTGTPEGWSPVVVLVTEPTTPDDQAALDELVEAAGAGGSGVALVVASTAPRPAGLELAVGIDGALAIPEWGLSCTARALTLSQRERVEAVVAAAAAEPVPVPERSFDELLAAEPTDDPGEDLYEDPPHVVLVECLNGHGVAVVGGVEPLTAQQTALVAFLAVRGPSSRTDITEALWGGEVVSDRRLHDLLHVTRQALGDAASIVFDDTGRYRLARDIRSDCELFELRTEYARHQSPSNARVTLRGALDLVGGPPFAVPGRGRRSYEWVDREHLAVIWERHIGDAAHALAQLALAAGDSVEASLAAQAGLRACAHNETLTSDLMEAEAVGGNPSGAERVFEHLEAAMEDLGVTPTEDARMMLERIRADSPSPVPRTAGNLPPARVPTPPSNGCC